MISAATELRNRIELTLENRIPRALTPPQRPIPERVLTGIASVDTITGGIPLGCLTEICGLASSGRTSVLLSLLGECIQRGALCALVDASDAFDPQSATNAGVDLRKLLWVRCKESGHRIIGSSGKAKLTVSNLQSFVKHSPASINPSCWQKAAPDFTSPDLKECSKLNQALKSTDLLLQAGGFGVVVLDLGDIPVSAARRIPLTTWFRFRRAVENTSTAFIVVEQYPHAKSCATLVMDLSTSQASWSEAAECGTIMGTHSGNAAPSFCVTAQGIAIPFEKTPASSFETPQRWNTPRARLLETVHVHLQVARSPSLRHIQKFSAQPERHSVQVPVNAKYTKAIPLPN